jgi:hypothetical protein
MNPIGIHLRYFLAADNLCLTLAAFVAQCTSMNCFYSFPRSVRPRAYFARRDSYRNHGVHRPQLRTGVFKTILHKEKRNSIYPENDCLTFSRLYLPGLNDRYLDRAIT